MHEARGESVMETRKCLVRKQVSAGDVEAIPGGEGFMDRLRGTWKVEV